MFHRQRRFPKPLSNEDAHSLVRESAGAAEDGRGPSGGRCHCQHRDAGYCPRGDGPLMNLPPQLETKFQTLENRYPVKRSALIPMLLYAQDQFGHVRDEMIGEIAARLGLNTL